MIECPTKPTQQRFKWVLRSLPSANTIKTEVLSPKNDFSPLCMSSGVERERERERERDLHAFSGISPFKLLKQLCGP